jgi:pimeloyl-ACP methyl ester carboxylesterase
MTVVIFVHGHKSAFWIFPLQGLRPMPATLPSPAPPHAAPRPKAARPGRRLLVIGIILTLLAAVAYAGRLSAMAVVMDLARIGLWLGTAGLLLCALSAWRATRAGLPRRTRIVRWVATAAAGLVCLLLARDRFVLYGTEEVRFTSGGIRLAGTLYTPRGKGPHPAVVIIHGSGPETRDDYAFYAKLFARSGIAALAYDKRGAGASTGETYGTDYSGYADDAVAAVRLLARRPGIAPDRVGLMGVSEAEWVGPLAAARAPEVAFLAVTSAAGTSPAEQVNAEIALRLRARGYGEPDVRRALELNDRVLDYQRTGRGAEAVRAALRAAAGEAWFRDAEDIPDEIYAFEEYAWWRSVMDFDADAAWARVTVPVLLLKGGADPMSPADEMQRRVSAALGRGGNRAVRIVVFPGADHAMLRWPLGEGVPPPAFADGYLDTLVGWVRETARTR